MIKCLAKNIPSFRSTKKKTLGDPSLNWSQCLQSLQEAYGFPLSSSSLPLFLWNNREIEAYDVERVARKPNFVFILIRDRLETVSKKF